SAASPRRATAFRLRGRTTGCLLLCTSTRFRFRLQASVLLSLAAGGFFSLLAAELFFFGAALRLQSGKTAIFRLTHLRVLQGPAACFHFALRQLVQHNTRALRLRTRRLPSWGRL